MEIHSFEVFTGSLDNDGNEQLVIELDSVETGIDLRNERMREHLFETQLFAEATVNLQIDPTLATFLESGEVTLLNVSPTLELHGLIVPVTASVRITIRAIILC